MEKECRDWPLLNRNLDELSLVYPTTGGGQSTEDLQALYEKVSLNGSQGDQGENIRDLLEKYLRTELETPVFSIEPMSPPIKQALLDNQEVVDKITNLLINEETLSFPLDLDIGYADPIPSNVVGLRPINELLVANALLSQSAGKMYNAWRYLEASSRLTDALFHHPSFISQVLAIVESKKILLAMRKMTVPAPAWAQGWPKHDFVKWMLTAYTAEAYMTQNIAKKTNLSLLQEGDSIVRKQFGMEPLEIGIITQFIYSLAGRQLLRLHAAGQIAESRHMIQQRALEGLCVSLPSEIDVSSVNSLPWYPGKKMLSEFFSGILLYKYWDKLYLLAVYKTGTEIILRTKAVKAKNGKNNWPRAPSLPSDLCLEHSWSYQHKPDGSVLFSYDKSLPKDLFGAMVKPGYIQYIGQADE